MNGYRVEILTATDYIYGDALEFYEDVTPYCMEGRNEFYDDLILGSECTIRVSSLLAQPFNLAYNTNV